MKDILLVANCWYFECEQASSRCLTLANMIVESGLNLEVITSTFCHSAKKQRQYDEKFLTSFPYKITLIHERGYSKNVSIKRLVSNNEFANNVMKYIKNRKKPDAIFCVVPSLDLAYVITKYANENNIKLIIDIQDLWPEAFKMVFSVPGISNLMYAPMKYKANSIYSGADEIIAVSETYVNHALKVNKKCKDGHSVFLGIELSKFDLYASRQKLQNKPTDEIWIVYIGTLGYSYDLTCVIDSIKILKEKGITNIKFIVMGDGPNRTEFENYAINQNVNVEFMGNLEYEKMVGILVACDIAVNPITKNSAASIINKHGDYLAAGLPILNTQESSEFRNLLTKYNAGLNCENNNPADLAKSILMLWEDASIRKVMGENGRKLAEEKFDRFTTYKEIVELIERV